MPESELVSAVIIVVDDVVETLTLEDWEKAMERLAFPVTCDTENPEICEACQ